MSTMSGWQPYSEATRWLVDHECFVGKTDEYSHLLLDGFQGGKAYIHTEDLPYFYRRVIADAKNGNPNYIVEQKSRPVFPFHLDVDCEDEGDMFDAISTQWIPLIQEVLRDALPEDADHEAVVCRAPNKAKKDKVKTGVHVHFPSLLVDTSTALELRSYIVTRLQKEYGPRPEDNPWPAVIDRSVLLDNGIRMLWSWKSTRCAECLRACRDVEKELGACQAPTGASVWKCACVSCAAKKERRRACPNKCSYGKLSEKREYAPIAVYDMAGNRYRDFDREECLGPDFALPLMWMTCVRWPDDQIRSPESVRASPPAWYNAEEDPTREEERRRKKAVPAKSKDGGDATPQAHRRTDCVSDTRPDYLVVARAVREAMGASITRLYCEGDGLKRVYQAWSHHKMCRNVDREHVSNNVWFEITCRGVSQRCHDDDCKGYASPPVPLPPAYYRRLFVSPAGADPSAPPPTPAPAPAPATAGKTASSTTASSRVLAGLLLAKVGYDPSKIVYGRSWKGKKSRK